MKSTITKSSPVTAPPILTCNQEGWQIPAPTIEKRPAPTAALPGVTTGGLAELLSCPIPPDLKGSIDLLKKLNRIAPTRSECDALAKRVQIVGEHVEAMQQPRPAPIVGDFLIQHAARLKSAVPAEIEQIQSSRPSNK